MQGFSSPAIPAAIAPDPLLSDSWFRSQLYGLDRLSDDFPRLRQGELADVLAHHATLQQFARPAINALAEKVADKQAVVILSDASGLVLNTFGDMQALKKAERFALAPGNLWSECGRGTNAIGTALAIDDCCEIDGQQHFLTRNQGLYCAAIPLQTPGGQIADADHRRAHIDGMGAGDASGRGPGPDPGHRLQQGSAHRRRGARAHIPPAGRGQLHGRSRGAMRVMA